MDESLVVVLAITMYVLGIVYYVLAFLRTRSITSKDISLVLVGAGLLIVPFGVFYVSLFGPFRFESTLVGFGILVFMAGITLAALHENLPSRYITYMWLIAFAIIASLMGASLLGTLLRP